MFFNQTILEKLISFKSIFPSAPDCLGLHPPSIMTVFNLGDGVEHDWISVQGLPALKERK